MTEELKCPVCSSELTDNTAFYLCQNAKCLKAWTPIALSQPVRWREVPIARSPMWVGYPSTACLLPDVELGRPEPKEKKYADAELAELLNMLMATNVHGAILQLRDHLDGDKRLLDNYQRLYKFRRGQS